MQCCEKRESENIKERRKIYAARDFFDKYHHPIKIWKFLIISLKRFKKISIEFANKKIWL
jgi:hypothetical protein